jgi:hypothetical protein
MPEVQEEMPFYRLIQPLYADDTYFPEGTELYFLATPNDAMEPLNEPARKRVEEYFKGLDEGMRASGRISRKIEDIVMQEMTNRPKEPAAATTVTMPAYKPNTPIMGNLDSKGGLKEAKIGQGSVRLATLAPTNKPTPKVVGAPKEAE